MELPAAVVRPPQPPPSEPLAIADERVHALLLCPISCCVMRDPVLMCDGHSYERASIEAWLALGHSTSPMTGLVLPSRKLWPNLALKQLAHTLSPRSADEEEKDRKREEDARRQQREQYNVATSNLMSRPAETSSEGEAEDEEDDGSSSDSESSSDEEEAEARGVLRVMSAMPARSRRRRGAGMVPSG